MIDPQVRPAGAHGGHAERPATPERLPWAALLVLAGICFVVISTETLPSGLLPEIATGLAVGIGTAGQLVGAYAIGTVVAALPAITWTARWRRRPVLLLGVTGFVVANAVTALSGDTTLSLTARAVAGAFSGLLWGLVPGYTRSIVPPALAGRGLAVAMAGVPAALAIGTTAGTFLGGMFGWRAAFAVMSVLALVLAGAAAVLVPDAPAPRGAATTIRRTERGGAAQLRDVLRRPGIAAVLAVVVAWMLAHNLLYTYVAPYVAALGVALRVDTVLFTFGVAALIGIAVTGTLVDRALRALLLLNLAGFTVSGLVFAFLGATTVGFLLATLAWGLTFGSASTLLNTAAVDAGTVSQTDTIAASVSTVWNLAIFGGSALGAVLLAAADPAAFPPALIALSLAALIVAGTARRHAFPPGPRHRSNSATDYRAADTTDQKGIRR